MKKVGVINGETGTVLTSSEKVEEPVTVVPATTTPVGSYSSGAKKPPGTNDASKKHKSSKVRNLSIAHFIKKPVIIHNTLHHT